MKEDRSITLHPTKGLNPHMTTCPRCRKETDEIALLGINDKVIECPGCGTQIFGYANTKKKCPKCKSNLAGGKVRELGEYESIPGVELCDECKKEEETFLAEVERGGIYWRCSDCKSHGVIMAESNVAKHVREKTGVKAPDLIGIEFSKNDCPECSKKNNQENTKEH